MIKLNCISFPRQGTRKNNLRETFCSLCCSKACMVSIRESNETLEHKGMCLNGFLSQKCLHICTHTHTHAYIVYIWRIKTEIMGGAGRRVMVSAIWLANRLSWVMGVGSQAGNTGTAASPGLWSGRDKGGHSVLGSETLGWWWLNEKGTSLGRGWWLPIIWKVTSKKVKWYQAKLLLLFSR